MITKLLESVRKLDLGIMQMRNGEHSNGETIIREAFDAIGSLIDPPCGLVVDGYYDYSTLPDNWEEQHKRNENIKPLQRHPYGVVNPVYNLDSGICYIYPANLKCSLRHGHAGNCSPSPADRERTKPPGWMVY